MNWEFSVGFYPGVLFGMRTYTERNKQNHVVIFPKNRNRRSRNIPDLASEWRSIVISLLPRYQSRDTHTLSTDGVW